MSDTDTSKLSFQQILALAAGKPLPPAPAAPDSLTQSLMQPESVSPMVRVGQGMSDIYGGAKQKYLNWIDPPAAAEHTKQKIENDALIEKGRAAYGEGGFDPLRMVGSVATPLSLIPMGAGGLLARTGMGAAAGGAGSYVNFDPTNTAQSNLTNTAVGAVGGGVLNAVAPSIVGGIIKGAQGVGNFVGSAWRSFAQKTSPSLVSNISNKVQITLQNNGIDFSKLSDAVRASVLDDAAQQFTTTGKLNPEMLMRKADIEAVGGVGTATKAQISRNPADWTAAQNIQKTEVNIPAVGRNEQESLTGRFTQQNANTQRYAEALQNQMTQTVDPWFLGAPKAATPLQASEQAIKAIQQKDDAANKAVGELYAKFRELGKGDTHVPDTQIAQTLGKIADEIGVENIPPAVLARLKQFGFMDGARTKLLTVTEADKLGRLIGNNNPGHGTAGMVSTQLKRAVDNALLDIPEIEATRALVTARNAARARFDDREAGAAVKRAIDDVAPDRFFQQNIIGGNVRDIVQLKEQLSTTLEGGQAWNSLREHTMKWIRDNSTKADGVFSGSKMNNAIEQLGQDRLNVIFTQPELTQIQTLLRGSKAMTVEPAFAAPNRSNTSPALVAAALRVGNKIPFANLITSPISKEVESSIQQKLLANALESGGSALEQQTAQAARRAALVKQLIGDRAYNPAMFPTAIQEQYKPVR